MRFHHPSAFFLLCLTTLLSSAISPRASAASFNFSGDARFRSDRDWLEHYSTPNAVGATTSVQPSADNLYALMRLRMKAAAQVNDEMSATARLTTGSNQFLPDAQFGGPSGSSGAGFGARWGFALDQAFLNYKFAENLSVQFGKVPVLFWTAGNSVTGSLWNFDQSLDGLQFTWVGDFGVFKPYITANYSVLYDRISVQSQTATPSSTVGQDLGFLGVQIGTKYMTEYISANFAVGSYNYDGIKGFDSTFTTFSNSYFAGAHGNTLNGNTFAYDYQEVAVDADLTYHFSFAPVSVFGSFITNSDGLYKTGTDGGLKIGNLKDVGTWFVSAVYKDFGRDAFFANYAEPFMSYGGTGLRSLEYSAGYQFWLNANVVLSYQASNHDLSDGTTGRYERYMLDVNAVF